jgi:hypothetical protein
MKTLLTTLAVVAFLAVATPSMSFAGEGCGSCKDKAAAKEKDKAGDKEACQKDKDKSAQETGEKKEDVKKG